MRSVGSPDLIRKAELKERQIPALLQERRDLSQAADYAEQGPGERNATRWSAPSSLNSEEGRRSDRHRPCRAGQSLNYWCSFFPRPTTGGPGPMAAKSGFFEAFADPKNDALEQQWWAFIPIGNGSYLIQNRGHQRALLHYVWDILPLSAGRVEPRGGTEQGWLIQPTEGGI